MFTSLKDPQQHCSDTTLEQAPAQGLCVCLWMRLVFAGFFPDPEEALLSKKSMSSVFGTTSLMQRPDAWKGFCRQQAGILASL